MTEARAGRKALLVTRRVVVAAASAQEPSAPRRDGTPYGDKEARPEPRGPVANGPGVWKRMQNLTRDLGAVVDELFAGRLPIEKREMVKAKLEVCAACEFWRPIKIVSMPITGWGLCAHEECGCLIGFKARLQTLPGGRVDCPKGKWDSLKEKFASLWKEKAK